jgi:hypothetical protein
MNKIISKYHPLIPPLTAKPRGKAEKLRGGYPKGEGDIGRR